MGDPTDQGTVAGGREEIGGVSGATLPLSKNVKALGAVSLLADVSSEMIYPLLPLFLTSVLGASATMLGGIEGLAETTSSFLKLASGWWADRVRRKKPMVVVGYLLSAIARPLVGIAIVPWHVLAVRMTDRTGKGIRTSPRDALLADSSHPSQRGRAFGFHRALDNVGAVFGPLLAWFLYEMAHVGMRAIFLWSALPGLVAVVVLVLFVKEGQPAGTPAADAVVGARGTGIGAGIGAGIGTGIGAGIGAGIDAGIGGGSPRPEDSAAADSAVPFAAAYWRYLGVLFVFTLAASSDAFLLLRAQQLGVSVMLIPIVYAAFNFVKAVVSTPGGALSDRYGRRPLIVAGWMLYALVYAGFATATVWWHACLLFVAYGVFYGLTEGAEKALVADLVPAARRGTAFGWFNFTVGIAALPASLLFGFVWDHASPASAFLVGAGLAGIATLGLLLFVPRALPARPD